MNQEVRLPGWNTRQSTEINTKVLGETFGVRLVKWAEMAEEDRPETFWNAPSSVGRAGNFEILTRGLISKTVLLSSYFTDIMCTKNVTKLAYNL